LRKFAKYETVMCVIILGLEDQIKFLLRGLDERDSENLILEAAFKAVLVTRG
jgi:hypothetical protein